MTDMLGALHQLVESATNACTSVAEHPRPGGIRPSGWESNGPGGERLFAKQNAGPTALDGIPAGHRVSAEGWS
ncbi:hypothetical protein [Streptomyces sp. NPDC005244]